MVDAGMKLYRLADLGIVWVHAQIYEQDLAYVQLGQEATVTLVLSAGPRVPRARHLHLSERGRKDAHGPGADGVSQPRLFPQAGHVRHGAGHVRAGAFRAAGARTWPSCAAARRTRSSWRWTGGKFEPRTVTLGPQAENDTYQVLSGLKRRRTRSSPPASSCSIRKASCARRSRRCCEPSRRRRAAATGRTHDARSGARHAATSAARRKPQRSSNTSARCRSTFPSNTIIRASAPSAA